MISKFSLAVLVIKYICLRDTPARIHKATLADEWMLRAAKRWCQNFPIPKHPASKDRGIHRLASMTSKAAAQVDPCIAAGIWSQSSLYASPSYHRHYCRQEQRGFLQPMLKMSHLKTSFSRGIGESWSVCLQLKSLHSFRQHRCSRPLHSVAERTGLCWEEMHWSWRVFAIR